MPISKDDELILKIADKAFSLLEEKIILMASSQALKLDKSSLIKIVDAIRSSSKDVNDSLKKELRKVKK